MLRDVAVEMASFTRNDSLSRQFKKQIYEARVGNDTYYLCQGYLPQKRTFWYLKKGSFKSQPVENCYDSNMTFDQAVAWANSLFTAESHHDRVMTLMEMMW